MSTIGIFIGSEMPEQHGAEDPSTTLRLSALAASWAALNGQMILALGDAPALLSVGTAVVGLQQGRVLEGGERRTSPIRVLSLLKSDNADRDRSLSFQRRGREQVLETPEESFEEEPTFGDLSLLMDLGIIDIAGDSPLSLQPRSPEMVAEYLPGQLLREKPRAILAIGQIPAIVSQAVRAYARDTDSFFACVLSRIDGAERLVGAENDPMLNNRHLRFQVSEPSPEESNEEVYYTADEELMRAAIQATWEADLTFQIYQWLTSITE